MPVVPFVRARRDETNDLPVVEIETPVPLAPRAEPERDAGALAETAKPKFGLRGKVAAIIGALTLPIIAYFGAAVYSHQIGDDLEFPQDTRTLWTAPWAGVSAMLLEREYADHGWSPGAANWSPRGRLTAMPAYQSALVEALAEHTELTSKQASMNDEPDPDLAAAARLLSGAPGKDQLRAAREAFVSFDGRARRRTAQTIILPSQLAERLDLAARWSALSADELVDMSHAASGAPFDGDATEAVYRAKARAYAAHRLISAVDHPYESDAHEARARALSALAAASEFSPLFVINGAADGWPAGSHTAAMAGLIADAQRELARYSAGVRRIEATSADPSLKASL